MRRSDFHPLGCHEGVLPVGRDWLWLALIVGIHLALLAGAMIGLGGAEAPVTPPAVMGVLVAPQPPATPVPQETLPATPQRQMPRAAQRPKAPAPPPLSNAPSSERAPTAPPAEPGKLAQAESMPARMQGAASPSPAPAPEPATGPAAVTPPRTDAAHLDNPAPQYPTVSRRFGEEGRVLFDVYILPDGRVGEIKLRRSSGHARLDEAALDAVRRWRYVPARRGNEPIPYWYVQPIAFSLNS